VSAAGGAQVSNMNLTVRGTLAWRHAVGDLDPAATLAFSGGDAFSIVGAPIAENAALIETGFDLLSEKNVTLGASYRGQIAKDAQDHAFHFDLAVRF
jgi:outer membrane autotransporter protein